MPITLQRAKALCSVAEFKIISASHRPAVLALSPAGLRRHVALARGLRDKYRTLAEHQQRQKRGKPPRRSGRTARAAGIQTTRLKQQVFQETLDRFTAALMAPAAPILKARPSAPAPKPKGNKTRAKPRAKTSLKPAPKAPTQRPAGTRTAPPPSVKSTPQVEARDTALRMRAARSAAALKSLLIKESGHLRHKSALAGRTRRMQAKRDSRPR